MSEMGETVSSGGGRLAGVKVGLGVKASVGLAVSLGGEGAAGTGVIARFTSQAKCGRIVNDTCIAPLY
jgi:hypothetical protein